MVYLLQDVGFQSSRHHVPQLIRVRYKIKNGRLSSAFFFLRHPQLLQQPESNTSVTLTIYLPHPFSGIMDAPASTTFRATAIPACNIYRRQFVIGAKAKHDQQAR
jgi:hypothetical protein